MARQRTRASPHPDMEFILRLRLKEYLVSPFRSASGLNKPLIIVFLLLNGIVLANAILHDPRVEYDVINHFRYIDSMAQFQLPRPEENEEFFSPPFPYALPSLACSLLYKLFGIRPVAPSGISIYNEAGIFHTGEFSVFWGGKFAQFLNILFSLGLTFYIIKICGILRPRSDALKTMSLMLLGTLPCITGPSPWCEASRCWLSSWCCPSI